MKGMRFKEISIEGRRVITKEIISIETPRWGYFYESYLKRKSKGKSYRDAILYSKEEGERGHGAGKYQHIACR